MTSTTSVLSMPPNLTPVFMSGNGLTRRAGSVSYGAMSNLTGNGPGGSNFGAIAVALGRGGGLSACSSASMGIPYKVGANLWIAQADSGSYYSTDLKTWQTATDFLSGD